MVQQSRNFYNRCGAMPLYDHSHRVFKRGKKVKIVEGEHISNFSSDPKRAWMNSLLGQISLLHVVDYDSLMRVLRGSSPERLLIPEDHPLRDKGLQSELAVFSRLTELDREEASPNEYELVLNNGQAPLALLARLADYAVTHLTEDRTSQHISSIKSPLFRLYSSTRHADSCLKADAKAGERLYAPIAELFGYPSLAGDILRHAYRINHSLVYAHVTSLFEDEAVQGQLHETQVLARKLKRNLKDVLKASGFQAQIDFRQQKHEGKVMRKFFLHLQDRFERQGEDSLPFQDFVSAHIDDYTLSSINDPIALKVILDSFRGKELSSMEEHEMKEVMKVALAAVRLNLRILRLTEGYKHKYDFKEKKNGYRAHHYDSSPSYENGKLPIEVQVKTKEWDEIASHGKAAHYYYIGGDTEFIDMVAGAYHDIIHRKNGG
jgi:hypothetical protein